MVVRSERRGLGALLPLVAVVVFVETSFYTAITPLLPHYVSSLHLTRSGAGILVAAYPIGTLVSAVPSGAFAGRAGVKKAVVAGLALMSAATLAFGFGRTELVADTARFAQGVGGSLIWAGGLAWLAAAAAPGRRAATLGIAFGAAVAGAVAGPVVGVIASRIGTRGAFGAATVAGTCLVLATLAVPACQGGDESPSLRHALGALGDLRLGVGLWLTFLAGLAFGIVNVIAPLRLGHLGAGAVVIGVTFLAAAAVETAVAPVVGRIADHRGRRRPVTVAVAAAIAATLLIPFAASASVLVVVLVVAVPCYGSLYVPAFALASDGAARRRLHQGLAFGLSNFAWAGGQAMGSAGAGALAQAAGDTLPFAVLAAVFAATLALLSPSARRVVSRAFGEAPG